MLKINPDNTHFMTLGTAERLRLVEQQIVVEMDNVILKETEEKSELLLGCKIQSNLKWHLQIEELMSKLRKRLVGIEHVRNIAPYFVRKQIAQGMFSSVLTYCLPLFGGMDLGQLNNLQILQNQSL